MSFYWCLDHKRVEEGEGCGSSSRIGPYDTSAQAATALERTKQREAGQRARDEAEGED